MRNLLTAMFIGFSWTAGACPESFEHDDIKVSWICKSIENGVEHREKQTRHTDSNDLIEVDFFKDSNKPYRRDVYETKYGLLGKYFFTYLSDNESNFKFKKIRVYDFNDELIAEHSVDVPTVLIEDSKNEVSLSFPKVLIIDSGFNYTHKDVFGKHFVNQDEKIDGIDNDGDGLIDNLTSFNGEQAAGGSVNYKFNLNQFIQLPTKGAAFTHGGFVSSVAMRDIHKTSFLGAGGDIHSAVYLYKILEQINRYDVRFTNMSFGFGDKGGVSLVDKESIEAVEGIMRASFNTLHVVASGNGSRNFDEIKYSEYPACINIKNKITVGALGSAEIDEDQLPDYKAAHFSNIGYRCVDIMAPGVDMVGAGLGNTYMKASGTSVSSPYVLNVLLKMYEKFDDLNAREYREILLKTAFVPKENPFPVKSGGIVFPKRALLAIDKVKQGFSISDSIWLIREEMKIAGELDDKDLLIKMWKDRKL